MRSITLLTLVLAFVLVEKSQGGGKATLLGIDKVHDAKAARKFIKYLLDSTTWKAFKDQNVDDCFPICREGDDRAQKLEAIKKAVDSVHPDMDLSDVTTDLDVLRKILTKDVIKQKLDKEASSTSNWLRFTDDVAAKLKEIVDTPLEDEESFYMITTWIETIVTCVENEAEIQSKFGIDMTEMKDELLNLMETYLAEIEVALSSQNSETKQEVLGFVRLLFESVIFTGDIDTWIAQEVEKLHQIVMKLAPCEAVNPEVGTMVDAMLDSIKDGIEAQRNVAPLWYFILAVSMDPTVDFCEPSLVEIPAEMSVQSNDAFGGFNIFGDAEALIMY